MQADAEAAASYRNVLHLQEKIADSDASAPAAAASEEIIILKRTNTALPRPLSRTYIYKDDYTETSLFLPVEPFEDPGFLLQQISKLGYEASVPQPSSGILDNEDDIVFPLLADVVQKHHSYLKSFVMHELNRVSSKTIVGRLVATSPLFAYFQLLSLHASVDIFLVFLESPKTMACLRWPFRCATQPSPLSVRPLCIAWTGWREFVLLRESQHVPKLEALHELVVPLKAHHISHSWRAPPVKKCPILVYGNMEVPEEKVSVVSILDKLDQGKPLNAVETRLLLDILSSCSAALASNCISVWPSSVHPIGISIVSCLNRGGAPLDLQKTSLGPFYCATRPISIPRCRPHSETIRLRNDSRRRCKIDVAPACDGLFVGFTKRKTLLSPGEVMDVSVHMVGLCAGARSACLLLTVDTDSRRRTVVVPIQVVVSLDSAEDLWEIELDHLVYDQRTILGEGSSSIVFSAFYFGAPVACKEFKQVASGFPVLSKETLRDDCSFLHECSILKMKDLHHPHIVRYYGASKRAPQRIISERLSCTLSQWLATHGGSDLHTQKLRLQVAIDVASGLMYLHERGLIHRDLKSPNILIDDSDRAKIGDLGMTESVEQARTRDADSSGARLAHSQPLSSMGSMPWMAPELRNSTERGRTLRHYPDSFFSADVYSYGVLLFEIWSGRCIMQHLSSATALSSAGALLRKSASSDSFDSILDSAEPSLGPLDADIHSLIKVCCSKDPAKRWSIRRILSALRCCMSKLITSRPESQGTLQSKH